MLFARYDAIISHRFERYRCISARIAYLTVIHRGVVLSVGNALSVDLVCVIRGPSIRPFPLFRWNWSDPPRFSSDAIRQPRAFSLCLFVFPRYVSENERPERWHGEPRTFTFPSVRLSRARFFHFFPREEIRSTDVP